MSRVRDLSNLLTKGCTDVDSPNLETVAKVFADNPGQLLDYKAFFEQRLPEISFEDICRFFLVFNAINYCYFDENGERFQDGNLSGSMLWMERLAQHWDIFKDPDFLSIIDENYLMLDILQAPISLATRRVDALRELGKFFLTNPDFTFEKLFQKFHGDLYRVSQFLPVLLPSWRDPFYKRAQLLVAMVYAENKYRNGLSVNEKTVEDLTIFADYRVPQTLASLGLMDMPTGKQLISGSNSEMLIRAKSVVVSDKLLAKIRHIRGSDDVNILHLDNTLWSFKRKKDFFGQFLTISDIDHHYTMSTDY